MSPWVSELQQRVARAQNKRFSNTGILCFTVSSSHYPKEMDLGEIVVSESPAERNLYAEKQPRSQDVLGRSGKQIHQVFKYLTGEMKEYGEWMKSKHGDMLGLSGMARWEHLHHQQ